MTTRILPEEYFPPSNVQLGIRSIDSESGETFGNAESTKSNTVIVRSSDDIAEAPQFRMCMSCLKRINPDSYFSWELMEFCNLSCISKFQKPNCKCICLRFIRTAAFGKFYIHIQKVFKFFCSLPCMDYYKVKVKICSYCHMTGNITSGINSSVRQNTVCFCSEMCYKLFNEVVKPPQAPQKAKCCVCKQEKCVNISLKHEGKTRYFCGQRCLTAYSFVELQTGTEQCIMCQHYFSEAIVRKYTVHYGNVTLMFCSMKCQNIYTLLNGKTVSCSLCQNKRHHFGMIRKFLNNNPLPGYICSVNCFKLYESSMLDDILPAITLPKLDINKFINMNQYQSENNNNFPRPVVVHNKELVVQAKPVDQRNVATMCFIPKSDKDITVEPDTLNKEIQTETLPSKIVLPTPVPVYVPVPIAMYSVPVPTAVPFPLPVPVPVFIPITKPVADMMSDVEISQNVVPNDPYEIDLLKIADVIAEEKNSEICSNRDSCINKESISEEQSENETVSKTSFKLEPSSKTLVTENGGIKRLLDNLNECDTINKKKPCGLKTTKKINLNYYLGVGALQHWIKGKVRSSEESELNNILLKRDILKMLPEELSFTLYSFLKELKKPNGSEYAPDTIYYLCLGIQYYLTENGRGDNIFLDKSYEKFFNLLNEFAKKFTSLHCEGSQVIVTRVDEEHLWETKQLGHHSALVLLNTLVYFNTKYYHCSTVEQHADILFVQILKLQRKKSKTKSMMLRFHPRQSKGTKLVYEQYANESDRTRCPIHLYELYLSKCPESVKGCNTSFYLQPEQYCTSDSPLWYTNSALESDILTKMINRVRMVKEINVALMHK